MHREIKRLFDSAGITNRTVRKHYQSYIEHRWGLKPVVSPYLQKRMPQDMKDRLNADYMHTIMLWDRLHPIPPWNTPQWNEYIALINEEARHICTHEHLKTGQPHYLEQIAYFQNQLNTSNNSVEVEEAADFLGRKDAEAEFILYGFTKYQEEDYTPGIKPYRGSRWPATTRDRAPLCQRRLREEEEERIIQQAQINRYGIPNAAATAGGLASNMFAPLPPMKGGARKGKKTRKYKRKSSKKTRRRS